MAFKAPTIPTLLELWDLAPAAAPPPLQTSEFSELARADTHTHTRDTVLGGRKHGNWHACCMVRLVLVGVSWCNGQGGAWAMGMAHGPAAAGGGAGL